MKPTLPPLAPSHTMTILPADFPLLTAATLPKIYGHIQITAEKLAQIQANQQLRLTDALDTIRRAVAEQTIRAVVLKDVTSTLNAFADTMSGMASNTAGYLRARSTAQITAGAGPVHLRDERQQLPRELD